MSAKLQEILDEISKDTLSQEELLKLKHAIENKVSQEKSNQVNLKELNHRIKNNLQLFHSMLQAEVMRTHEIKTKQTLLRISNQIAGASKVNEALYEYEENTAVSTIDFLEKIQEDFKVIYYNSLNIDFKNNIPPDLMIKQNFLIQLGMLTNELLGISFKIIESEPKEIFITYEMASQDELVIKFSNPLVLAEFHKPNNESFKKFRLQVTNLNGKVVGTTDQLLVTTVWF